MKRIPQNGPWFHRRSPMSQGDDGPVALAPPGWPTGRLSDQRVQAVQYREQAGDVQGRDADDDGGDPDLEDRPPEGSDHHRGDDDQDESGHLRSPGEGCTMPLLTC